jgi:hypothetical protein
MKMNVKEIRIKKEDVSVFTPEKEKTVLVKKTPVLLVFPRPSATSDCLLYMHVFYISLLMDRQSIHQPFVLMR